MGTATATRYLLGSFSDKREKNEKKGSGVFFFIKGKKKLPICNYDYMTTIQCKCKCFDESGNFFFSINLVENLLV